MNPTPERTSATNNSNEKPEKSYLTAAVESFNPWAASRSSTPDTAGIASKNEDSRLKNQHGKDHSTPRRHGLGSRRYPPDCPPLNAKWFYAVDVPKRKPKLLKIGEEDKKPLPPPKKFVTFSDHDSRAIENAYQVLAEEYDDPSKESQLNEGSNDSIPSASSAGKKSNTSMHEAGQAEHAGGKVMVPVQEDFLFDVDVEERELCPVYWLGPIYEVRRGSWFFQEGSTYRPCEENLAGQLEEGYLKIKPFRYPKASEASSKPTSALPADGPTTSLAMSGAFSRSRPRSADVTPKASVENLRTASQSAGDDSPKEDASSSPHQPQAYRLFGTYMNSVVTYQDSNTAWLANDNILSRINSTVYQKFSGSSYLGGVKLVRGYPNVTSSAKEASSDKTPASPIVKISNDPALQQDERQQKLLKRRSAPPSTGKSIDAILPNATPSAKLTEHDFGAEEEAARKREEKNMKNDYNDRDGESQGRKVEHLILVTHGIGQRLGMRTESVNFIHDVNILRKTLKNVYEQSADLQALNSEIDKLPKNCRVQVLPVCWRHLLEFPKKSARPGRREHDISDAVGEEEELYPSLEDITVEGVPFVRSLITDLALDILLYQSAYREFISSIVLAESNRIYRLFCERNPDFNGKVSLIGHSLGSAILFDILCRQKEEPKASSVGRKHRSHQRPTPNSRAKGFEFDFEVEDFYCLGSPVGLFQMLKGRNILARSHRKDELPAESPLDMNYLQDPFFSPSEPSEHFSTESGLPFTISSPKIVQLYNIFHPSDPIAYRLEPLISTAMSSLKPQALPYTKKGISASVSGLGATIGQSVSGFWSTLSSGVVNSILNRSLGLSTEDVASMQSNTPNRQASLSVGAGTNVSAGVVPPDTSSLQWQLANEEKTKVGEKIAAADRDGKKSAITLIDPEMETLYAGFQNRRQGVQQDHDGGGSEGFEKGQEIEEKAMRLRREEAKVRALNSNGRVDYVIQESMLDFNPINTIGSHLSYWSDEDVSHFMMSQLLSRNRVTTRAHTRDDSNSRTRFENKIREQ